MSLRKLLRKFLFHCIYRNIWWFWRKFFFLFLRSPLRRWLALLIFRGRCHLGFFFLSTFCHCHKCHEELILSNIFNLFLLFFQKVLVAVLLPVVCPLLKILLSLHYVIETHLIFIERNVLLMTKFNQRGKGGRVLS